MKNKQDKRSKKKKPTEMRTPKTPTLSNPKEPGDWTTDSPSLGQSVEAGGVD